MDPCPLFNPSFQSLHLHVAPLPPQLQSFSVISCTGLTLGVKPRHSQKCLERLTTLPSMSRSLSSPASSSSTYPSIAPPPVPPLPNEYQSPFSNDGMPNGTFGSLARRYHKAAPESTMKPLNRPRRGPTISIDSTATSGDVGASVWADFVAPGAPRSNPLRSAPVQTNGLGYHPPQTATLNRGYAGPASTLGRTRGSVDFNGSAGLGSEYVGLRRGLLRIRGMRGMGRRRCFQSLSFKWGVDVR
ncbi:hypothetical protein BC829DRAFT_126002 [Chytridium lagenaria]|nr:hypothetical protein BC829DRAFT_126002 [Chytridium lagenaria]